jgi:hypothetical protein
VTTWETGDHWHDLDATDKSGLSISEGVGSVTLFLFTTTKLFPGTACFLFGNLKFAAHLLEKLLGLHFVLLGFLSSSESLSAALPLGFELALQIGLRFLRSFLFGASVKEPTLEFALGRGPQTLEFNDSMEQVSTGSRQVCDLAGQLLAERIPLKIIIILLELAHPVASETFPVRRQRLPSLECMRESHAFWLL